MPPLPTLEELAEARHPLEDTIQTLDGHWVHSPRPGLPHRRGCLRWFGDHLCRRDRTARERAAFGDRSPRRQYSERWEIDLRTKEYWCMPGHDRLFGYEEDLPQWNYERSFSTLCPSKSKRSAPVSLPSAGNRSMTGGSSARSSASMASDAGSERGQAVPDHRGRPVRGHSWHDW